MNELELNWSRLVEITSALLLPTNVSSRDASNMQDELNRYLLLLSDIRHDRHVPSADGGVTLLGMQRAPGSKDRHHNVEGGLVKHLLQMWEIWVAMRPVLGEMHVTRHPLLSDANVWKCILHHDLNKVWRYKDVASEIDRHNGIWRVDYANDNDRSEYLLGSTNKVIFLLGKHGITLNITLLNALMTAEGGFSPGPRPKTDTVLAKMAYLLDEMSANVIDRLQTNRFWDSKEGGISDA